MWLFRALTLSLISLNVFVSGCGFQPLYRHSAASHNTLKQLSLIRIAPIEDRIGQKMRNFLNFALISEVQRNSVSPSPMTYLYNFLNDPIFLNFALILDCQKSICSSQPQLSPQPTCTVNRCVERTRTLNVTDLLQG